MDKTVVSEVARSERALAVGIMCPSFVAVAHLAAVQQSFKMSFITSFWSVVLWIYITSFIVGKEGLQRHL